MRRTLPLIVFFFIFKLSITSAFGQPTAEEFFKFAIMSLELKLYDEAIESIKQAIRKKPEYAGMGHLLLGGIYVDLERYEEAILSLKEAVLIFPENAEAHVALGMAYFKVNRIEKAKATFKEAIRLKSDNFKVHGAIGEAYMQMKLYDDAIPAFKEAIRLKPDDSRLYKAIGESYVKLERYDKAIAAFKKAIRIQPEAKTYNDLGVVYDKLKRYEEAISAFEEAIYINPKLTVARNNLENAYVNLKWEFKDSQNKSVRGKPNVVEKQRQARDSSQFEQSITAYQKVIEMNPDDAEAHLSLGKSYSEFGFLQKAIRSFQEAVRIQPNGA